ncbi:MAG TPA: DUF6600 domain-containing protein, partial [Xanthobacteraceae bacterium]|nr:DUF6600 domain-containing protein [Xanthobacteraceae bacterium]
MSPMKRTVATLLTSVACVTAVPIVAATVTPAVAQERVQVTAEFRTALEPYGEFRQHQRWGEVWVPARVAQDWEPYTVGHWVDSADYGWYWVSDQAEADWGWVTFHYGRWVRDREMGWIWVPGRTWGPGFVSWRRGGHRNAEYVGWAPEPPDELIVDVRDEPDYWVFVRARDFTAPRIADVILPRRERVTIIHDTVIENRTVLLDNRGFAVNPGIPPAFVAAAIGRPIATYHVRPVVLAGTANIAGATVVQGNQLRQQRTTIAREASTAQRTNNLIRPSANVPPPQALPPNARTGRLDVNPPRAAQGATTGAGGSQRGVTAPNQRPGQPPATNGQAPNNQPNNQPNRGAEQGRPGERGATPNVPGQAPNMQTPNERRGTTGTAPHEQPNRGAEQRRPGERGATPKGPGQAPGAQMPNERRGTTGAAPQEQPNRGAEQRRPGERGATSKGPGQAPSAQTPNERRDTTGAAPHEQLNRGAEQRRPGERGATPKGPGQAPSAQTPNERRGTTGAAPQEQLNRGGERRPPGAQQPSERAPRE